MGYSRSKCVRVVYFVVFAGIFNFYFDDYYFMFLSCIKYLFCRHMYFVFNACIVNQKANV
jgi:hypothetical protein